MAVLAALVSIPLLAAGPPHPAPGTVARHELDELLSLYHTRDYFTLRERLAGVSTADHGAHEIRFLVAAVEQAFNRPEISNGILVDLLAEPDLAPELRQRIRHLQLDNWLRLHRYAEALQTARELLAHPADPGAAQPLAEARSKLPLLQALADVPPQQSELRASSRLALGPTRRVPLAIGDVELRFGLDTGANFSVIMRSEAVKLGLAIRPAGVEVSTSTARKVTADVAIADRVEIGNVHYRHVVFLVLPDHTLTFADGHRIPGLIGLPLIAAMGEVRFRRDHVMEIPRRPPRRTLGNLALDMLDPLVRVRYGKDDLVCRLDTGARRTVFYEPFYRRNRERLESATRAVTVEAGGVGGVEQIPALRLPKMVLTVAAAGITLRGVDIYTRPVRAPHQNYLDCNLGLDVLEAYRAYAINFRDLALVLR